MTRAASVRRGQPGVPRGWLLAVCSGGLAVAAHGSAGGDLPQTPAAGSLSVVVTVLVAWVGTALADTRHRLAAVLALLGTGQLCLHLMLTQLAVPYAGHDHPVPAPVNGWVMFVTHLLATLISAGLLLRAEDALEAASRVLARLRRRVRFRWCPPVGPPTAPSAGSVLPIWSSHLLEVLFRQVCSRRGPPVHS